LFFLIFKDFWISQSDQYTFGYPQLPKMMKEQICY